MAIPSSDHTSRRRSSSRCSTSDMEPICSSREGGCVSSSEEGRSIRASGMGTRRSGYRVADVRRRDRRRVHRTIGRRAWRQNLIGGSRRRWRLYFFLQLQPPDFLFDLADKFILGAAEFGERAADLPPNLRQPARAQYDERQQQDENHLRFHMQIIPHCRRLPTSPAVGDVGLLLRNFTQPQPLCWHLKRKRPPPATR